VKLPVVAADSPTRLLFGHQPLEILPIGLRVPSWAPASAKPTAGRPAFTPAFTGASTRQAIFAPSELRMARPSFAPAFAGLWLTGRLHGYGLEP
jgi:hypothetical protein